MHQVPAVRDVGGAGDGCAREDVGEARHEADRDPGYRVQSACTRRPPACPLGRGRRLHRRHELVERAPTARKAVLAVVLAAVGEHPVRRATAAPTPAQSGLPHSGDAANERVPPAVRQARSRTCSSSRRGTSARPGDRRGRRRRHGAAQPGHHPDRTRAAASGSPPACAFLHSTAGRPAGVRNSAVDRSVVLFVLVVARCARRLPPPRRPPRRCRRRRPTASGSSSRTSPRRGPRVGPRGAADLVVPGLAVGVLASPVPPSNSSPFARSAPMSGSSRARRWSRSSCPAASRAVSP